MNEKVIRQILTEKRMAYAICDANLTVVEVGGEPGLLWDDAQVLEGARLSDQVLELAGCEEELKAISRNEQGTLRYDWVNRERDDGETLYLSMSLHAFPREESPGLVYLVEDRTEEGKLHQELMQGHNELRLLQSQVERHNRELAAANAELRLTNEIKSTFVTLTAHELRTPLTTIHGYLEMFVDGLLGELSELQHNHLSTMYESSRRVLSNLANLLDAMRIESDRVELLLRPTSLTSIIERAVEQTRAQFQAKHQQLTVDTPPDLPLSLCDSQRAEQIVENLLSNASKFSPQGGQVALTIDETVDGHYLQISIRDTGTGMDSKRQDQLFTRLHRRSEGGPVFEVNGTGLGLFISQSLIELHGGKIWCESEPGRGSVFHITFPAVEGEGEVKQKEISN